MLELTSKHTSSSKESLRSIKVDEEKCEDETNFSFFKTKILGTTFATNVAILGVKIVP